MQVAGFFHSSTALHQQVSHRLAHLRVLCVCALLRHRRVVQHVPARWRLLWTSPAFQQTRTHIVNVVADFDDLTCRCRWRISTGGTMGRRPSPSASWVMWTLHRRAAAFNEHTCAACVEGWVIRCWPAAWCSSSSTAPGHMDGAGNSAWTRSCRCWRLQKLPAGARDNRGARKALKPDGRGEDHFCAGMADAHSLCKKHLTVARVGPGIPTAPLSAGAAVR